MNSRAQLQGVMGKKGNRTQFGYPEDMIEKTCFPRGDPP